MKLAIFPALFALASAASSIPDQVYIESLTYGGSGCPRGTVSPNMASDRKTFTLIFDQYVASIGPGIPITDNRKNCQLNIGLRYPAGWRYSVLSSQFRGYAKLDAGVVGTHKVTYYFAGQTDQVSATCNFYGPTNRDYLENGAVGTVAWSPCGADHALNVNSQVRLETSYPNASGMLANDSQDGKWTNIMTFQWGYC